MCVYLLFGLEVAISTSQISRPSAMRIPIYIWALVENEANLFRVEPRVRSILSGDKNKTAGLQGLGLRADIEENGPS